MGRYSTSRIAAAAMTAVLAVGCSSTTAVDEANGSSSEAETSVESRQVGAEQESADSDDQVTQQTNDVDEQADPAEPIEVAPDESVPAASSGQAVAIAVPDIGAAAWAVVIAGASDQFDPLLEETEQAVIDAGYDTTITNCDVGAATAFGMAADSSFTVSVYAANEQNAIALADELAAAGLAGEIAEISVDCG